MKNFVIWLTSFSLVTSSMAMAAPRAPQVTYISITKDLIRKTGLSEKPVKLKDLYEQSKYTLPLDFRFEMERFLEVHPNYAVPRADVRMVKVNKKDAIQFSFRQNNKTYDMVLAFQGDNVGTINYSVDGKNFRRNIAGVDVRHPVEFMNSVVGPGVLSPSANHFVRLMSAGELAHLKPEQQKAYWSHVHATLQAMEKVQNAWVKERNNSKKTSFHNVLLGDSAWADEAVANNGSMTGKSCLVYGWIGSFNSTGGCDAPAEAKTESCGAVCNPDIYGTKDGVKICGQTQKGFFSSTSGTAFCGKQAGTPALAKSDTGKVDEDYKRITIQINKLKEICTPPASKYDQSMPSALAQKSECDELRDQLAKLESDNAAICRNTKQLNSSSYCADLVSKVADAAGTTTGAAQAGVTPVAAPATPTTTSTPADKPPEMSSAGQTDVDADAPARPRATSVCDNLPRVAEDCAPGTLIPYDCGGHHAYACRCPSPEMEVRMDTREPVHCTGGVVGVRGGHVVKVEERHSWFADNWPSLLVLGVTLLGGWAMIHAQETAQKAAIDQYYSVYQPVTPSPVAAPVPAPTTTSTSVVFPTLPGTTSTTVVTPTGTGVLRSGNRNSKKAVGH